MSFYLVGALTAKLIFSDLKNQHKYMTEDNMVPAAEYIPEFGRDDRLERLIEDEELEDFMEQKQEGMDLC